MFPFLVIRRSIGIADRIVFQAPALYLCFKRIPVVPTRNRSAQSEALLTEPNNRKARASVVPVVLSSHSSLFSATSSPPAYSGLFQNLLQGVGQLQDSTFGLKR